MKLTAKLNIALFIPIIFGIALLNLFHRKPQEVSVLEQRSIQQAPAFTMQRLFSGEFTRDYDNYFSDNFTNRNSLVKLSSDIKGAKGIPDKDGASIYVQYEGAKTAVNEGDPTQANVKAQGDTVKYLVLNDRAFTLFSYSPAAADDYAEALNHFQSSIDPRIHVYSLLAPSSIEFAEKEKYRSMSDSQKDAFAYLNKKLVPSIKRINAYETLDKHKGEYIYFRTDHHWTQLGAYYAYTSFMNATGEKAVPLSQYKKGNIEGFLGTAYNATLSDKLKSHPDVMTYYIPSVQNQYTAYSTKNEPKKLSAVDPAFAKRGFGFYAAFLGGDFPWGEIATGTKNGKRIVVVKDSYANTFIPFLIPHYEKIYYVDPRHYNGSLTDFVKQKKATDVLFMNTSTVARNKNISTYLWRILPPKK